MEFNVLEVVVHTIVPIIAHGISLKYAVIHIVVPSLESHERGYIESRLYWLQWRLNSCRQFRTSMRVVSIFSGITGDNDGNKENMDDNADQRADRPPRKPRRPNGPRANRGSTVSVFIGGLPRSTRVSQLKVSVREREVQPLAIIWHGGSGHAFLLFPAESEANDALNKLSGLEMNGKTLRVEMAKPRGRRQNSEGDREGDRDGEETEKGSSGEAQVKAEPEPEPAEA